MNILAIKRIVEEMAVEMEVSIEQICKEIIPSCALPALLALSAAVNKELASRASGKPKSSKAGGEQPAHLAFNAEWTKFVMDHVKLHGWIGGWSYSSGRKEMKSLVEADASIEHVAADGSTQYVYPDGSKFMASHGQQYAKFLKESNHQLWRDYQEEHEVPVAAPKAAAAPKKTAEEVAIEKARVAEEKKLAKEAEKAKKEAEKKAEKERIAAEKKAEKERLAASSKLSLTTTVKLRTTSVSPASTAADAAVEVKPMQMPKKAKKEVVLKFGECTTITLNDNVMIRDWRNFVYENEDGAPGDFEGVLENGKLVYCSQETAEAEYYKLHPDEERM